MKGLENHTRFWQSGAAGVAKVRDFWQSGAAGGARVRDSWPSGAAVTPGCKTFRRPALWYESGTRLLAP